MRLQKILLPLVAITLSLSALAQRAGAQTSRLYQQMTQSERAAFVSEQARQVARRISGTEYEFTPAFEAEIQRAVDDYAARVNNHGSDPSGRSDVRPVFERGRTHAPLLINAFKSRNLSPLMGLYIPLIESEYTNTRKPNAAGAVGMFQFLPKTGERYGLTTEELLNVEKSADAAARLIADSLAKFKDDPMKEALALLSYNRGAQQTARDLQLVVRDENRRCTICALTAARDRLDQTFQNESVHYVPSFFAAAIVGENPQAFGLSLQPLSSYDMGH